MISTYGSNEFDGYPPGNPLKRVRSACIPARFNGLGFIWLSVSTRGDEMEASVSFWRLYYHLVWATKNREPIITTDLESKLYPYLLKKAAELDVRVYALNGWLDHVHMVVSIPPKLALADVVKNLKGASAHYLNQETATGEAFIWQRGYGALSVGERQKSIAIAYVQSQKEHHVRTTTNAWLERCSDIDEGPSDSEILMGKISSGIRERKEIYELMGESLL